MPTLLATLDEDLPDLRFLLVSGEACPADLAARWAGGAAVSSMSTGPRRRRSPPPTRRCGRADR
ncbi:hypothetical protein NKH77_01885 [Streptomyces sp. M19]